MAVAELSAHIGREVELRGWIADAKRARSVGFLLLRDRTGTVQIVDRERAATPPIESAVRVAGTVRAGSGRDEGTAVEIELRELEVLARASGSRPTGAPIARHLELRPRERALVFEVQSTLEAAWRRHLLETGFLEIHTPKLSAGGSESGAAVFELPYFGERACLVQSPQFYMQLAMAAGLDRVFEVGPVFRAEEGVTNRHAAEFTCMDVEIAWIESLEELLATLEALLSSSLSAVQARHGEEIERRFGLAVEVPEHPLPRYRYEDALALAGQDRAGARLSSREEQAISKHAQREAGTSFAFVLGYPSSERPFYTMREEGREPASTFSFDLLWRGIEVCSGCLREHRPGPLREQIAATAVDSEALASYLEDHYLAMFEDGCPPHGGFGVGLNRTLMALLGLPTLGDATFVFRGPGILVP